MVNEDKIESERVWLPSICDGEDKSSPFVNCIRKKYRHIRKWAKRTETNCFRIYDRELHHYPLAIDFYDGRYCIYYFSPNRYELDPPEELVDEVEAALRLLFCPDPTMIFWKCRMKRSKHQQYEKQNACKEFFTVLEYGVKFRVNLLDYLDTGLFLDHRETRQIAAKLGVGKRVLNLFAYTCSFSVHAAAKGATFTKSVDLSNTYTDWGKENFLLNDLPLQGNRIVRADCLSFLDEEIRSSGKYGLIIIDPPTISRSKSMDQMFDVQIDHPFLIEKALKLLNPDGTILFSTNSRKFLFNEALFPRCSIQEISHKTLPIDFLDPKIHRCWKIHQ